MHPEIEAVLAGSTRYAVVQGDLREVLAGLPNFSFDAIACDPPYGFRFMGKSWDYDVPSVDIWRECLRVLKPGAPLVAFGGSRTYHRLACGIEDAGFELRDCLHWLYAKGFPKSQNIGLAIDKDVGAEREVVGSRVLTGNAAISTKDKGGTFGVQVGSIPAKEVPVTAPATALAEEWDGYGTALKPAYEPIVLARKPLDGTMAENVARWGVGGLAIDACRVGDGGQAKWSSPRGGIWITDPEAVGILQAAAAGRWPANLLLDEAAAEILDAEVGPRVSGVAVRHNGGGGQIMSGVGDQPYKPKPKLPDLGHMDGLTNPPYRPRRAHAAGAAIASRFFFCSKVSTWEREFGCEGLPLRSAGEVTEREDDSDGLESPRAGAGRTGGARNHHPTLKPVALTTWLARLIMPPRGGRLLVPFAGAGSEMVGAMRAGWTTIVGIEREAEYVEIARARLHRWSQVPANVDPSESRPEPADEKQANLFVGKP